jgi:lipopolysaccharide assembly protein B
LEINLAWLLAVPVVFALGWVAARFDRGQQRRESRHVPKDILNAMSLLLAGDAAKATDALLSAARSQPDAMDLHRSVGNLYRQRGLTDRAIEVHEAAMRHPGLTMADRVELALDLARDYLAAGLFDRASDVLVDLLKHALADKDSLTLKEAANQARLMLLQTAQRTRDWRQAIYWADDAHKSGAAFASGAGHSYEQLMGHFYCELAALAVVKNETQTALAYLTQADAFAAPGPAKRVAIMRAQLAGSSADESPTVRACTVCGFRSKTLYWQCPGCHHWDSFEAAK